MSDAGLDSEHVPFGIDFSVWRPPVEDERQKMRKALGIDEDTFVVLTVADNQERKNLDGAMQIFSKFCIEIEERNISGYVSKKREKVKAKWLVVTRLQSSIGWDLDDLSRRYGIMDNLVLYERGIPIKNLWGLYLVADAFLLTSKAEGLAVPVLEAMATGLLCIGSDFAAIREHLRDGRGWLIKPDYRWLDVFGNSERIMVDIDDGVRQLQNLHETSEEEKEEVRQRSLNYVRSRTWEVAGEMVAKIIDQINPPTEVKVIAEPMRVE